jgi:hypothetical protein
MRKKYLKLFPDTGLGFNFEDEILFRKGKCKTIFKILGY